MDWADPGPDDARHRPVDLQVDRQHAARVYDYPLGGLDIVEPGVVSLPHWRPDRIEVGQAIPSDAAVSVYGGVARKP